MYTLVTNFICSFSSLLFSSLLLFKILQSTSGINLKGLGLGNSLLSFETLIDIMPNELYYSGLLGKEYVQFSSRKTIFRNLRLLSGNPTRAFRRGFGMAVAWAASEERRNWTPLAARKVYVVKMLWCLTTKETHRLTSSSQTWKMQTIGQQMNSQPVIPVMMV